MGWVGINVIRKFGIKHNIIKLFLGNEPGKILAQLQKAFERIIKETASYCPADPFRRRY